MSREQIVREIAGLCGLTFTIGSFCQKADETVDLSDLSHIHSLWRDKLPGRVLVKDTDAWRSWDEQTRKHDVRVRDTGSWLDDMLALTHKALLAASVERGGKA